MKSMNKIIFTLLLACLTMTGCVEEIDFQYENSEKRIVIDGSITNQPGPYYFHLSESITQIVTSENGGYNENMGKPVKNATVVLSDNAGNQEQLRFIGERTDIYDPSQGWYIAESMTGVVGRTYTLTVMWNEKTYVAVDKMKEVSVIDRIDFRTKHLEAKNEDVTIPLIYFHEPQDQKNYYLMYYTINGYKGNSRNWAFSILDDQYLNENVNGLEIDDGQSPSGRDFYYQISTGDKVAVYLESLSPTAYFFYKNLIEQFDSDGGAFSPNPASPPSNISNGGLGLFRASAVSVKKVTR
jgi:hypothetical protein